MREGEGELTKFEEIVSRHQAATKGPHRWFGNTKVKNIYLATIDRGRIYIMEFVRWGMGGACPTFQPPADGSLGWNMIRADERVQYEAPHRKDFVGIDHPDAIAIERSWEDIDALITVAQAAIDYVKAQIAAVSTDASAEECGCPQAWKRLVEATKAVSE